mmetsp:Transcript_28314/g.67461  ORF Transcript_28314/g.67461 Transcript_28314/m.67461 type:complete len:264 (+) Transcript_28314:1045-1836(+)
MCSADLLVLLSEPWMRSSDSCDLSDSAFPLLALLCIRSRRDGTVGRGAGASCGGGDFALAAAEGSPTASTPPPLTAAGTAGRSAPLSRYPPVPHATHSAITASSPNDTDRPPASFRRTVPAAKTTAKSRGSSGRSPPSGGGGGARSEDSSGPPSPFSAASSATTTSPASRIVLSSSSLTTRLCLVLVDTNDTAPGAASPSPSQSTASVRRNVSISPTRSVSGGDTIPLRRASGRPAPPTSPKSFSNAPSTIPLLRPATARTWS